LERIRANCPETPRENKRATGTERRPVEQEAYEAWRALQGQEQEKWHQKLRVQECKSQATMHYTIHGRHVEYEEWSIWWEQEKQEKQRVKESI
jgi:hypothetical protein